MAEIEKVSKFIIESTFKMVSLSDDKLIFSLFLNKNKWIEL